MAAKEVGNVFTNRRATEVSGAGGGPVEAARRGRRRVATGIDLEVVASTMPVIWYSPVSVSPLMLH